MDTGNLPSWAGAAAVYSKAYRVLEGMARRGHASPAVTTRTGRVKTPGTASLEMARLIEALNDGNEERIKGLLLMTDVYLPC